MKFPNEFSSDLVNLVRDGIRKTGQFPIGRKEMKLLCATSKYWAPNPRELLRKFAETCGVDVVMGSSPDLACLVPPKPMTDSIAPRASDRSKASRKFSGNAVEDFVSAA